ncbi:PorV/PorQ family protein [bacterium]|nr:PorV/PorQ family protein [bacterium]
MKRIAMAVVLGMTLVLGFSGTAAASGAGAINLVFPIGARYNALGEAGTALSQDVTAQWWNAGGFAFMPLRPQDHEIHVMQSSLAKGLADDIGLYWVGYGAPLGETGALGFYLNYLDMGEQVATDEGNLEKGTFSSYEWALGVTYGVRLSSTMGVGIGVKYFRDKLADDQFLQDTTGSGSGDSFGVDFGMLWKLPSIRSNFGVSVANLGPGIQHVNAAQTDPMPRKITFGLAHSLYQSEFMGLLFVGDYLVPLYKYKDDKWGFGFATEEEEWGVGAEWNYLQSLFIRFGYKSAEFGKITDTTYGFGVNMDRWTGKAITFDFASVPQAEGLPSVSRLSFGYRF